MTSQGNFAGLAIVVAAPFIGSFLGTLVVALPRGDLLRRWRSACAGCGATLGIVDLFPIVSFVVLGGRCRHCGGAIPWRLPAIELATLVLALATVGLAPSGPGAAVDFGFGATLLALAWIDAETMRLPDVLTLPLLLAGLAVCAVVVPGSLPLRAAAAALCYLGLTALGAVWRQLRGIDAIGQGDAKLLAAGAAWVAPADIPWVMIVAGGLGLAGFAVVAWRPTDGTPLSERRLAFGPALCLAIWLVRMLSVNG